MHVNPILKYAAHNWIRPFFNILLDTVFPAKCLICGRLFGPAVTRPERGRSITSAAELADTLAESNRLLAAYCCPDCVSAFMVISAPICSCCGIMFKSRQGRDHLCGDCIVQPKKFRIARAAVAYDHQLLAVVHRFKYAGKIQLAAPLGGLMHRAFKQYWDPQKVDLILPVPLHPIKFRERGFNQSYLLIRSWKSIATQMTSEISDIPVNTDILIRSKATVSQTGLGRLKRLKNIRAAFRVDIPEKVLDKKVLLVDDVYTTGATVNECARVLLKAGAEAVDVLTVARAM